MCARGIGTIRDSILGGSLPVLRKSLVAALSRVIQFFIKALLLMQQPEFKYPHFMRVRGSCQNAGLGVYGQAPGTDPHIALENRFYFISDQSDGAAQFRSCLDGLAHVPDQYRFDITVVPHCRNHLIVAKKLNDKIVDGMRLPRVQVALQAVTRWLRGNDQHRLPRYALRREPWRIDINVSPVRHKVEIMLLGQARLTATVSANWSQARVASGRLVPNCTARVILAEQRLHFQTAYASQIGPRSFVRRWRRLPSRALPSLCDAGTVVGSRRKDVPISDPGITMGHIR